MPDLVLLVNGIPLVVVECKSPSIPEPLAEAVDQLRRYTNQRRAGLRGGRQRRQRAAVRHQPVAGRHQLRRGARGLRRRDLRTLRAVEDGGRTGRQRQRDRGGAALGKTNLSEQERLDRRPAGARAPAGRGEELHAVHAGGRPDHQVGVPLPAVPGGKPGDRAPQDRARN